MLGNLLCIYCHLLTFLKIKLYSFSFTIRMSTVWVQIRTDVDFVKVINRQQKLLLQRKKIFYKTLTFDLEVLLFFLSDCYFSSSKATCKSESQKIMMYLPYIGLEVKSCLILACYLEPNTGRMNHTS